MKNQIQIKQYAQIIDSFTNDNISYFLSILGIGALLLLPEALPIQFYQTLNIEDPFWALIRKFLFFIGWAVILGGITHAYLKEGEPPKITKSLMTLSTYILAFQIFLVAVIIQALSAQFKDLITTETTAPLITQLYLNSAIEIIAYIFSVYFILRISPHFVSLIKSEKISFLKTFKITNKKEAEIVLGGLLAAKGYFLCWIIFHAAYMFFLRDLITRENELANIITVNILYVPLEIILKPIIAVCIFLGVIIAYDEATTNQKA